MLSCYIIILLTAGIIAGLLQYLVVYKELKVYEPPAANLDQNTESNPANNFLKRLYLFIKNHWQFFGYIIIGIAGALLTPVVNELVNNNLPGLDVIARHAKCIPTKQQPVCTPFSNWYYLILLGYGIIFGYTGIRLIKNISGAIVDKLSAKVKELESKLASTEARVAQLQAATTSTFSPVMANNLMDNALATSNYFDKHQNELEKTAYYKSIDLNKADLLFNNLNQLISQTHKTRLQYKPSIHLYPKVDKYEDGLLRSIYSGNTFDLQTILEMDAAVDVARADALMSYAASNASAQDEGGMMAQVEESLPYNCEHVVPQSWFHKKEPMRGDLHHLFTCESRCNSFRANTPYYDFPDYENNAPQVVRDECGKSENNGFEPEQNKGAVARAVLYFLLRYPNTLSANPSIKINISTMIKWHKNSAVTLYELHRNREIFKLQGNRNPLIDYPELADKIKF